MATISGVNYLGFEIPFPPTVNHMYYQIGARKVRTKEYRAFIEGVGWAWKINRPRNWSKDGRFGMVLELTYANKRRNDGDNRVKPTQDALTACGVWNDDSQVDAALPERMELSADGKARAVVWIFRRNPARPKWSEIIRQAYTCGEL